MIVSYVVTHCYINFTRSVVGITLHNKLRAIHTTTETYLRLKD